MGRAGSRVPIVPLRRNAEPSRHISKAVARLQPVVQTFDLGDVVAFATGQDEVDRIAQRACCGMDLGASSALGAYQRGPDDAR